MRSFVANVTGSVQLVTKPRQRELRALSRTLRENENERDRLGGRGGEELD
jgi:hypothetical protein